MRTRAIVHLPISFPGGRTYALRLALRPALRRRPTAAAAAAAATTAVFASLGFESPPCSRVYFFRRCRARTLHYRHAPPDEGRFMPHGTHWLPEMEKGIAGEKSLSRRCGRSSCRSGRRFGHHHVLHE